MNGVDLRAVQPIGDSGRRGAGVDQDIPAGRRANERGVALADIEKGDAEALALSANGPEQNDRQQARKLPQGLHCVPILTSPSRSQIAACYLLTLGPKPGRARPARAS